MFPLTSGESATIVTEQGYLFKISQLTHMGGKVMATDKPAVPGFMDTLPEDVRNALSIIGVTEITEAVTADEITGGWVQLKDKEYLVGRPFYVVKMGFNESDTFTVDGQPSTFVVLHVVTDDKSHDRFVITDGSSGIKDQCLSWVGNHGDPEGKVFHFPNGLRVSKYTKEVNGETVAASTFYLA